MHVSDAAQWATIAGPAIAFLAILISFTKSRSVNQRDLRDQLRQQLRQINRACHVYFEREGWEAITTMPQYSFQALNQVRQDGLLSPGGAHVKAIEKTLRQFQDGHDSLSPKSVAALAIGPSHLGKQQLDRTFHDLDALSQRYLRALARMDNSGIVGYLTYLRYKFGPARP